MTLQEVMDELESMGTEQTRKTFKRHGLPEPFFGVKIGDMKKIQKRVKKDYQLAMDLYDTGNLDAMYLAGLITDDQKMTKKDLQHWVNQAHCCYLCQYTIAWVASESKHGHTLANEWIKAKNENKQAAGWSTYSSLVSIKNDDDLEIAEIKKLLQQVEKQIHQQPKEVCLAMNNFLISVGCYVADLTDFCLKTAKTIGKVTVDMGDTACKVPDAAEYIKKVQKRGTIGKKRKTAKC